jgi:O-antigen/teichoic acid export membrane protein
VGEGLLARTPPVAARFSNRRAYAQTFAATAAIRCFGVVSGVLAARLLGPEGRGELAVIIFLPMLLVSLGELELPRSLAYEVSRVREIPAAVIATGFWLAMLLGCVQAILLAVLLPHFLPADKLHVLAASRWFMLYLPAALVCATLMGCDQGRGRFGRFSIYLAMPGILYTLGIALAWAIGWASPVSFALALLVATLATMTLRVCLDRSALWSAWPDREIARRLLTRGISYYLPAVAGFVLSRADMFILVRLAPSEAIGLYAVAQAIAQGQLGAVNPFIQVSFSAVAGETGQRQALETLARHFRLAQLAAVSAGLLAMAAAPWLIRLMFGARFAGALQAAWLLTGAAVLRGMGQVLEQGLRAAGHPRPGIVSNLLGLVVLVGLGVPACLRFGINGVASSLLAAQFLNLAVLISFCITCLGMPVRSFWTLDKSTFGKLGSLARSPISRLLQV